MKVALFKRIQLVSIQFLAFISVLSMTTLAVAKNIELESLDQTLNKAGSNRILTIHGSNTIGAQLSPALVQKWLQSKGGTDIRFVPTGNANETIIKANTKLGKEVSVMIEAHGSSTGFKGLKSGQADIAASSRRIKASENVSLTGEMNDIESEYILAIDGLAIVVNKDIDIAKADKKQLIDLFSGKIKNWTSITGQNIPVKVFARDAKSGTFDTFKSQILASGINLIGSAKRYESNGELVQAVGNTSGAIGFSSIASANEGLNYVNVLEICDTNAMCLSPSIINVAIEDYLLSRRLYMYQMNNKSWVKEFLEFSLSTQGQQIAKDVGFISQNVFMVEDKNAEFMPTGYKKMAEQSKRLSFNIRLEGKPAKLDNKAIYDIDRLIEFLEDYPDYKLALIGFTNTDTTDVASMTRSKAQIIQVKRILKRHNIKISKIGAYGSLKPVASNGEKNQRIEVWLETL